MLKCSVARDPHKAQGVGGDNMTCLIVQLKNTVESSHAGSNVDTHTHIKAMKKEDNNLYTSNQSYDSSPKTDEIDVSSNTIVNSDSNGEVQDVALATEEFEDDERI